MQDPKTIAIVVIIIILCIITYYFYKKRKDNDKDGKLDPNAPIGDYIQVFKDAFYELYKYNQLVNYDIQSGRNNIILAINSPPFILKEDFPQLFNQIIATTDKIDTAYFNTFYKSTSSLAPAVNLWDENDKGIVDKIKNAQRAFESLTAQDQVPKITNSLDLGNNPFTKIAVGLKSAYGDNPMSSSVQNAINSLPQYDDKVQQYQDTTLWISLLKNLNNRYNDLLTRVTS